MILPEKKRLSPRRVAETPELFWHEFCHFFERTYHFKLKKILCVVVIILEHSKPSDYVMSTVLVAILAQKIALL